MCEKEVKRIFEREMKLLGFHANKNSCRNWYCSFDK